MKPETMERRILSLEASIRAIHIALMEIQLVTDFGDEDEQ